jgi:hypothetical protein
MSHLRTIVRRWLRLIATLMLTAWGAAHAEKLVVFYPTEVLPQVLQSKMEDACPGVSVTVFGRCPDVQARCAQDPPDAVIASALCVQQMPDYDIVLTGTRNGTAQASYVILSTNTPLDLAAVGDKSIAVVDITDRKSMESLAAAFFKSPPKFKHVTKIDDLTPTLALNLSAGILVEDCFVDYCKRSSASTFIVNRLPDVSVRTIAVCAVRKNSQAPASIKAVKTFNSAINGLLKVQQWK